MIRYEHLQRVVQAAKTCGRHEVPVSVKDLEALVENVDWGEFAWIDPIYSHVQRVFAHKPYLCELVSDDDSQQILDKLAEVSMPTEEQLEIQRLEALVDKLTTDLEVRVARLESETMPRTQTAKDAWFQRQVEDATITLHRLTSSNREAARLSRLAQSRELNTRLRALDEKNRDLFDKRTRTDESTGDEEVHVVEVLMDASVFHMVRARSWDEAAMIAIARPLPSDHNRIVIGEITGCTVFDTTGERMSDYNESGE